MSLRDPGQTSAILINPPVDIPVRLKYDSERIHTLHDEKGVGPASGLVSAHRCDKTCHWLVGACDYPLITDSNMSQLLEQYRPSMTCSKTPMGLQTPCLEYGVLKLLTGSRKM